jgi:hypothetical protein
MVLQGATSDDLGQVSSVAEVTQSLFKDIAGLEHELLTTGTRHNEKVAEVKSRPRVRELAVYFEAHPDSRVYLPDSLYHVFWEMKN